MTALRSLVAGFALSATAFAAADPAAAQGTLSIYPGAPSPDDVIALTVAAPEGADDPCVLWQISDRDPAVVRVTGYPPPGPLCPSRAQTLVLGTLSAGRTIVTARIDGDAELYAELRFDVLATPENPARLYDVAVAPPSPGAGEPFAVTLSVTSGVCAPANFTAPPVFLGQLIVFDGDPGSCPFEPPPGLVTTGFRHRLQGMTAGDKTIEVRAYGNRVATFGFHVEADSRALGLDGGAFTASLRWTDRTGVEHDAHAQRLSDDSGQFWFFATENPEVTIKVIDGRAVNDFWWVFISSMTDLPFTLTVRNGLACSPSGSCYNEKHYTQAAGRNRNFIDTSAFAAGD